VDACCLIDLSILCSTVLVVDLHRHISHIGSMMKAVWFLRDLYYYRFTVELIAAYPVNILLIRLVIKAAWETRATPLTHISTER
jgi:hypothetical protein